MYRSLLQNIVSFIGLFCKRDLSFYILQKRPVILRSVLIVATPYFVAKVGSFAEYKMIGLFCKRAL